MIVKSEIKHPADSEGPIALVTGGTRGIGRAIVEKLAQQGYRCVVNFVSSNATASSLCRELSESGFKAIAHRADVRNIEEVERMKDSVISLGWADVDVLVNNAGIISDSFHHNMDIDSWKRVIDTNLTGVFNCCRVFVPGMRSQRKGKIINIASFVGLAGNLAQTNYAASKAGVIGLTKSLALELARYSVTVNAIAPGFIETDMLASIPEDVRAKLLDRIPLRRFGKAEEVAEAVAYLASPAADYVTGHVLSINGGIYM